MWLRILVWGEDPGLPARAQGNHKGLYKGDVDKPE